MYRILILDEQAELEVPESRSNHEYRVPQIGEHVFVKYNGQTKVCEVEDVWTHLNLESAYQGAVQVVIKWSKGMDPKLFLRRR